MKDSNVIVVKEFDSFSQFDTCIYDNMSASQPTINLFNINTLGRYYVRSIQTTLEFSFRFDQDLNLNLSLLLALQNISLYFNNILAISYV